MLITDTTVAKGLGRVFYINKKTLVTSSFKKREVTKKKEKVSLKRIINSHFRRIGIKVFNMIFDHDLIFWLIGLVNRHLKIIKSVFIAYPANENYALSYVYKGRISKVKWDPWLVSPLWQNGKLTLMFVISSSNGDFKENNKHLRHLVKRTERIRKLLCAERKTFAGTLPGILYGRIVREAPEAELTADVIVQIVQEVEKKEALPNVPVIILGGRGFIGRRVVKRLKKIKDASKIYSVDLPNENKTEKKQIDLPNELRGKKVIMLNITLKGVISNYIDQVWPGMIIINEVYPEPDPCILECLKNAGCICYHIVGVRAKSFPKFPGAYWGAIPCCAAWPSKNLEAVARKIN